VIAGKKLPDFTPRGGPTTDVRRSLRAWLSAIEVLRSASIQRHDRASQWRSSRAYGRRWAAFKAYRESADRDFARTHDEAAESEATAALRRAVDPDYLAGRQAAFEQVLDEAPGCRRGPPEGMSEVWLAGWHDYMTRKRTGIDPAFVE
jgi:hypothetical protein